MSLFVFVAWWLTTDKGWRNRRHSWKVLFGFNQHSVPSASKITGIRSWILTKFTKNEATASDRKKVMDLLLNRLGRIGRENSESIQRLRWSWINPFVVKGSHPKVAFAIFNHRWSNEIWLSLPILQFLPFVETIAQKHTAMMTQKASMMMKVNNKIMPTIITNWLNTWMQVFLRPFRF